MRKERDKGSIHFLSKGSKNTSCLITSARVCKFLPYSIRILLNSTCDSLCVQLLYLIPRLLPETRRTPLTAAGPVSEYQEDNLPGLWSSVTDTNSTWRKTAWHLWRHPAFYQLQHIPQYKVKWVHWVVCVLV